VNGFFGQAMLTLIVDTNVNTTRKITKLNSANASVGGRSNFHFVKISCKPAFTFRVAILSENVFPVEVVHANLPIHPSIHPSIHQVANQEYGGPLTSPLSPQLIEASGVKGTASTMG